MGYYRNGMGRFKSWILVWAVCFIGSAFSQEQAQSNTTICWDASFSMLERDLEKEFGVLDKIFIRNPNQTVQLLIFNINIKEEEFAISNGNWEALKSVLINQPADGATIYTGLEEKIKYEEVYFFTDGNNLIANRYLPIKKGNFIINSVADRNEESLKKSALLGRGRLIDLAAILPENSAKQAEQGQDVVPNKAIEGVVYVDNVPTANVEVRVKGTEAVYTTDASGKFNIPAVAGDSVLFSSRENRTIKTLPIGYFTNTMDIFLKGNITALDEVVLVEQRIDAEYDNQINTGVGLKNKDGIGYAVQSIGEEQITAVNTDLSSNVSGRFSGVSKGRDLSTFSTRGVSTLLGNTYGLIVIDGVPIEQSDSSIGGAVQPISFLNPDMVKDITLLKGFAATNRYGTLGNNGVLLITTKTGSYAKGGGKKENSALLTNNLFDPEAKIIVRESPFTTALKEETSVLGAYRKYLTLRNFNGDNPVFYLDSFAFFKNKDARLAATIISNLWELYPNNDGYLKLVELSMRSVANYDVSQALNDALNTMKPTALQPFFTEAQLKFEKGDYQAALDAWSTLSKGGAYGTMQVAVISKSLDRELKNLLFFKKTGLDVGKVPEKYFKNTQMNMRLKMEWSNPKAEFQVQFVNPQNRYFNWEHTTAENKERIEREVSLGFAMEEFELYDDLIGDWQININYLGNLDKENREPLVVFCSVYTNFGYPSQTRELIWLYLDNQSNRKQLISFKI